MLLLAGALAACTPGIPDVGGVRGVSPNSATLWQPPEGRESEPADSATPAALLDSEIRGRLASLTLGDVIDLGLQNNPTTRASWANARAAANRYGSARGANLPTIDGDVTATRLKTAATQGRSAVEQSVFSPTLTLTYLLFDFGGRSGSIRETREALVSANYLHNATLQNAVLQIQQAYFEYGANRALLGAQRTAVEEARTNLAAAEERQRVGVATIADVLQARTALSQALLDLQAIEGQVQTARGALALAMGLPANLPYDIDSTAAPAAGRVADSVETLIRQAVINRPDLAAAGADYEAARARIARVRAGRLPSLDLSASTGRSYSTRNSAGSTTYSVSLGLRVPLFAGFSREYDEAAARAQAQVAGAERDALRQQVIFEVFSSYYDLETATRRVRTAEDLVTSATQSSEVALGRYRAGVGSVLDLISAQTALANARAQQIQAQLEWNIALARLTRDAGVLEPSGSSPLRLTPDLTDPTPARP